ncbi:helix-turn-helix domain-containing protein [Actinospica durhamensis]|uniref:Helix-turn-helix domain-containing protein n=1 Tax=Actinospica durhamensis TaxID=1508375 RepID=A0A941IQY4_9ACTN|nr:AraC family transcriptional regulator [Actinospica durhamensis]MBR7831761.1 helix-turn-helix domain-containing protein [Actinospica durhamensis]
MEDDLPMDTSRDLFHFTDGAQAYAGRYLHRQDNPLHTHSFMEIAFTLGGRATHHCLAGRRELEARDVVVLRPGVWHGYEDCHELELYNCCFSSELLRRELSWMRDDPLLGHLLWAGPYASHGRGTLALRLDPDTFDECVRELESLSALRHLPPGEYRGDLIARLTLIFGVLARSVVRSAGAGSAQLQQSHPAVGRVMRMLEADIARPWTLAELAEQLHLAPGYLVRLFKAATGLPPIAYLAQLRVEHAAVLLLHSDEPVTAVGRAVGWPDQNYFARRFKAHYGLSATTYRQRFATYADHHGVPADAEPVTSALK